jgi:hypothetical protein
MNRVRRSQAAFITACLVAAFCIGLAVPASAEDPPKPEKLTVSASFDRAIYERDIRYENALVVKVMKSDKPLQNASVEVTVWLGLFSSSPAQPMRGPISEKRSLTGRQTATVS